MSNVFDYFAAEGVREAKARMGIVERLRNGGQTDMADMAQEMLDALQAVEGTLSVFVTDGTAAPDSVIGKNLLRVRAAIAKAEGRA